MTVWICANIRGVKNCTRSPQIIIKCVACHRVLELIMESPIPLHARTRQVNIIWPNICKSALNPIPGGVGSVHTLNGQVFAGICIQFATVFQ